jgi:hypothetical protein
MQAWLPFSFFAGSRQPAGLVAVEEVLMRIKLAMFAVAGMVSGMSSQAMAQYVCPPGYAYYGGACQPLAPSYSNPVSGAMSGEAAGAAAGPVGAVVGGAIGTATGALSGTANMFTPPAPTPTCAPGYMYYNGSCYPAR